MYVSGLLPFLPAGDLETDRVSAPLDARELKDVRFQLQGTTTDTPVGTIYVQVAEDFGTVQDDVVMGLYGTANEKAKWVTVSIPLEAVHGLGSGQAWAAGSITWNGTAVLAIWISLLDAGCMVRIKWDNTSAGSGTGATMTIRGAGRSR